MTQPGGRGGLRRFSSPVGASVEHRKDKAGTADVTSAPMSEDKQNPRSKLDLEAEAMAALDEARRMPAGPERTEAMKRAGILRNAADLQGVFFAKRGRPVKT